MIDLSFKNNELKAIDTSVYKARNVLSVQIGSLSYAPNFGIDYDLFFNSDLQIQDQTFQAYAVSKLAENGINPVDVLTEKNTLDENLLITIDDQ
jgi:hypothetical protein